MKLNADIGESYGPWKMGNDAQIVPLIDQANIACGYHGGDALTIQKTLGALYGQQVEVGAHVSYPDLQGFGRRSMQLPQGELIAMIHAQIATLEGMAKCQDIDVHYVKPHGAMYNDMMRNLPLFETIVQAVSSYHRCYELVVQALPDTTAFTNVADKHGVKLRFEAFADRAYTANGLLVSRDKPNAVLSEKDGLCQAWAMINGEAFDSECQTPLNLKIDTICVHSDTPDALGLCSQIRALIVAKADSASGAVEKHIQTSIAK